MRAMQSFFRVGLFSTLPGVALVAALACSKDDIAPVDIPGLKIETFVCIVLDLSLPDASGYSLIETLSQEGAY